MCFSRTMVPTYLGRDAPPQGLLLMLVLTPMLRKRLVLSHFSARYAKTSEVGACVLP